MLIAQMLLRDGPFAVAPSWAACNDRRSVKTS